MLNLARVMLASCVCLGLGCGATSASDAGLEGAANAAAGSAATSLGGASAAGSSASTAGGAAHGNSAEVAGQTSIGGSSGAAPGSTDAGGAGRGEESNAGAGGNNEPSDVQQLLDTYRTFTPQSEEPVSVSGYLFGLCRLPTLRETEFLASIHGSGRYLRDWANDFAVQGLASKGAPAFPLGAVIVKEKYAGAAATQADLVAIAVMIKRPPGFDPAHGDWDYAYYEPALGIVQNAEQSAYCSNCHAAAASTDFVYVDGLKP